MSTGLAYMRFELRRTFRNRRFLVFSLGFPLVLYFVIAAPNKNEHSLNGTEISVPLYFMVGLVAFGTMSGVLSAGARIAAERAVGWNRQLRITPLAPRVYFRAKVATAYATALLTTGLLYLAGASLGVRLSAGRWLEMTGLILVGLIPFVSLGVMMGHLLTADSVGPAIGGATALLAFLGGVWFPLPTHGFLHVAGQALPSYWLVRASHVSLGGRVWSATGWFVIAAWTLAGTGLAFWAYRRDTARA